jgi:hypothetical protein
LALRVRRAGDAVDDQVEAVARAALLDERRPSLERQIGRGWVDAEKCPFLLKTRRIKINYTFCK